MHTKASNLNESVQDEFKKGQEAAKIRSRKQAIITALLQGTVLAIAIFNGFPIIVKVLIFIVLSSILGGLLSSKWIQSKWETQPKRKSQDSMSPVKQPDDVVEEITLQALQEFNKEHPENPLHRHKRNANSRENTN